MKVITALFEEDNYCKVSGLWQYDYGQILSIEGLNLPKIVEIHFSLDDKNGDTITRIGLTENSITTVHIPDVLLENNDITSNYNMYAFIYIANSVEGNTEYRVTMPVKARPKPNVSGSLEEPEIFHEVVGAVNKAASETEQAKKEAESWAHGHADYPEREEDNAAYYAALTKKDAASVSGRVEEAKKNIDNYVRQKEAELKGERGDVYFAAFKVVGSRLIMCSDPTIDKIHFYREGSRLKYRVAL